MGILGLAITGFLGFFVVRTIIPTYFMKNKENLHLRFNKSKTNQIHFIIPSIVEDATGEKFGWLTLDSRFNLVAIKEHTNFGQSSAVLQEQTLSEFKKDLSIASLVTSFDVHNVMSKIGLDGQKETESLICLKVLSAEFARKVGADVSAFELADTVENLFGAEAKDLDSSDLGINLLMQAKVVQKFGELDLIPEKTPVLVN